MPKKKRSVEDLSDQQLRDWADEHLQYEWETMLYAGNMLGPQRQGMIDNVALESFLVHARCLNDFLWHGPPWGREHDVFAVDFCDPNKWTKAKVNLPQDQLRAARERNRWGREIMHMTTRRISGTQDNKAWPVGPISREILQGLTRFGELALDGKISGKLRATLRNLAAGKEPGQTIPLEYHGGTVHYPATGTSEVWAGGTWSPPKPQTDEPQSHP